MSKQERCAHEVWLADHCWQCEEDAEKGKKSSSTSVGEVLHEFTREHSGGSSLDYPAMAREIIRLRESLRAVRAVRAEALEEAAKLCESSDRHRGDYFSRLIREAKQNGDSKP